MSMMLWFQPRPYKENWSHERTMAALLAEEGRHFDPVVLKAFVSVFSDTQPLAFQPLLLEAVN